MAPHAVILYAVVPQDLHGLTGLIKVYKADLAVHSYIVIVSG